MRLHFLKMCILHFSAYRPFTLWLLFKILLGRRWCNIIAYDDFCNPIIQISEPVEYLKKNQLETWDLENKERAL